MDYSNFKHLPKYFSISKATRLRLVQVDSILNSTGPIPLRFKDTFIGSKADKTLSRETYTIPVIFTANSPAATELAIKSLISHPKYFSISGGQGLAVTDSFNPKPFINKIMPEDF